MGFLKSAVDDIKSGENLDSYLTILISLTVLVLDIIGITKLEVISEATLAVMALLAFGALTTRQTLKNLNTEIKKLNTNLPHKDLIESGVQRVHNGFPREYFEKKCSNSKEICILETWIDHVEPLPRGLTERAKFGTMVRILLLNIDSSVLKQRVQDLGNPTLSDRVKNAMSNLEQSLLQNDLQTVDNIRIKYYNAIPPFSLYKADDLMLVGFFWHHSQSSYRPYFEISYCSTDTGKKVWGHNIMETFDKLWEQTYPLETLKAKL